MFQPGKHQLSTNISLHGVKNVSFRGVMNERSVTIVLGPQASLSFDNCDGIVIESLCILLSDTFEYGLIFSDTVNVYLHNIMFHPEDRNSTGCSAVVSQASVISISHSSFVEITCRSKWYCYTCS